MPTKTQREKPNKLYRTQEGRMLAGVCGGLGIFFNIDPTIVRLIFLLITLFGGGGVILYLVLWLIIPSETSKGNIDEENIKKNAEEIKVKAQDLAEDAKNYTKSQNARVVFGAVLLGLGIFLLLQNFGFFRFFNIWKLWPLVLIFLAISMLSRNE